MWNVCVCVHVLHVHVSVCAQTCICLWACGELVCNYVVIWWWMKGNAAIIYFRKQDLRFNLLAHYSYTVICKGCNWQFRVGKTSNGVGKKNCINLELYLSCVYSCICTYVNVYKYRALSLSVCLSVSLFLSPSLVQVVIFVHGLRLQMVLLVLCGMVDDLCHHCFESLHSSDYGGEIIVSLWNVNLMSFLNLCPHVS